MSLYYLRSVRSRNSDGRNVLQWNGLCVLGQFIYGRKYVSITGRGSRIWASYVYMDYLECPRWFSNVAQWGLKLSLPISSLARVTRRDILPDVTTHSGPPVLQAQNAQSAFDTWVSGVDGIVIKGNYFPNEGFGDHQQRFPSPFPLIQDSVRIPEILRPRVSITSVH